MCLVETRRNRRDESLSVKGLLRVQRFGSMYGLERIRRILVTQSAWQNGGTVIPPRVFQGRSTKNPLNKGSPSDFPHGLRARAGARAHPHTPKQLKSCWS